MRLIPKAILRLCYHRSGGPLVSIIVATRNNAGTIANSLKSLLDQTHRNIEIIVIDDASDDNSLRIIEDVARHDPRIVTIRNNRQLGTGRSRNLGLRAARGDYITFQDGDDFSEPDRIAAQLAVFANFDCKTLSLCNYVRINATGHSLEINKGRVMKCIISMMFPRKEVIDRVGYFFDGSLSEDSDYYERIKIAFGPSCEVLVFRTLYQALYRPNSSFFSNVQVKEIDSRSVSFERGTQALEALAALKDRHRRMKQGELGIYVGFRE